jgi:signal transduction histidine kinase
MKNFPSLPNLAITSGPLRGLSVRLVVYAMLLTLAVVWVVRVVGHFESPFWTSFVRGAMGALTLLFAYTLAGNLQVRWVSQRTLKYLMIPVLAPLGIFVGYVLTMPGDDARFCGGFFENYAAISGWARMSVGAVLVASLVVFMAINRERDRDAQDQELRFALERERLERKSVAAHMEAMRARMEPHFLFNTLANIQQLVQSQSPQASAVLSSLIAYLRTAIVEDRNGLASLSQEFDRAKHYLAIMQMRMPDRLQFDLKLPEDLGTQVVPTFSLLTLVENAIAHGIDPMENGGKIYLEASVVGDQAAVEVRDTGAGVVENSTEGFGLRNLRDRLAVLWPGGASLTLQGTAKGTVARITLPQMSLQEATIRFSGDDNNKARGSS